MQEGHFPWKGEVKKIAPNSEISRRQEYANTLLLEENQVNVFGSKTLAQIDDLLRREQEAIFLEKPTIKSFIHEKCQASQRQILERWKDPRKKEYVQVFLSLGLDRLLATSEGRSLLARSGFDETRVFEIWNRKEGIVDARRQAQLDALTNILMSASFPDTLWITILRKHQEQIAEKTRAFRERYEEDFKTRLQTALQQWLDLFPQGRPLPISKEDALKRIADSHVFIFDAMGTEMLKGFAGAYRSNSLSLYIREDVFDHAPDSEQAKEFLFHVFVHESRHLLAGRTSIQRNVSRGEFSSKSTFLSRHGCGFGPNRKMIWLDEAIVETDALFLSQFSNEQNPAHTKERELLKELVTKSGIPYALWETAQFEDYDVENQETGVPRWKELQQKLKERYGAPVLRILDRYITQQGIGETLLMLRFFHEQEKDENARGFRDFFSSPLFS